jgi:acyl-[acyl-carrier-protein] desaturase
MSDEVGTVSKHDLIEELDEPIARLYDAHVAARGELWMPADIVFPANMSQKERIEELVDAAQLISPAVRVIYALALLTEESLPVAFNVLAQTLSRNSVFNAWLGRWRAEEDRHGQLLLKLADISGMMPDAAGFERWRFKFIERGFRFSWSEDPYSLLAYTAVQEEDTRISHANLAVLFKKAGAGVFAEPLGLVAAEENFHGRFYRGVVKLLFERDPDRMLCSLSAALANFEMPGFSIPQFAELSYLVERHATLTPALIANAEEKLFSYWGVGDIDPESQAAEEAKHSLYSRLTMLRERQQQIDARKPRPRTFAFPCLSEPFRF